MKVIKIGKPKPKRKVYINSRGAGKSSKYWGSLSDRVLERLQINAKRELERRKTIEPKSKGNWVNNENLDEIKFPCFCSYRSHSGKKHYAQLIKNKDNGKYKYELLRISQDNGESIFLSSDSLRKLIRKWDIHILKGKITLFEEDTDEKYDIDIEE